MHRDEFLFRRKPKMISHHLDKLHNITQLPSSSTIMVEQPAIRYGSLRWLTHSNTGSTYIHVLAKRNAATLPPDTIISALIMYTRVGTLPAVASHWTFSQRGIFDKNITPLVTF